MRYRQIQTHERRHAYHRILWERRAFPGGRRPSTTAIHTFELAVQRSEVFAGRRHDSD